MRRAIKCLAVMSFANQLPSSAFQLKSGSIINPSTKLTSTYTEALGRDGNGPTVLFIHGLDSSAQTWRGVQRSLDTPSIAVDCRGCGRSDLGDPNDFTPDSLVGDIKSLVRSHRLLRERFVLVGHSMGGRLAMAYAANYPNDICALVIEDMDIRRRSVGSNIIQHFDEERAIAFSRGQDTMDDLKRELEGVGYSSDFYDKWINEGRIEEESDGKVWSGVNPAFRALCYRTVFDSTSGEDSWLTIARNLKQKTSPTVHLMLAGLGTVCDAESVGKMREIMSPGSDSEDSLLSVKTYEQGTHSIHNSARDEFMRDLAAIIKEASATQSSGDEVLRNQSRI